MRDSQHLPGERMAIQSGFQHQLPFPGQLVGPGSQRVLMIDSCSGHDKVNAFFEQGGNFQAERGQLFD